MMVMMTMISKGGRGEGCLQREAKEWGRQWPRGSIYSWMAAWVGEWWWGERMCEKAQDKVTHLSLGSPLPDVCRWVGSKFKLHQSFPDSSDWWMDASWKMVELFSLTFSPWKFQPISSTWGLSIVRFCCSCCLYQLWWLPINGSYSGIPYMPMFSFASFNCCLYFDLLALDMVSRSTKEVIIFLHFLSSSCSVLEIATYPALVAVPSRASSISTDPWNLGNPLSGLSPLPRFSWLAGHWLFVRITPLPPSSPHQHRGRHSNG